MIARLSNLAMAASLLSWVTVVCAQEATGIPLIGVLRASSPTQHDPAMDAMRTELSALGYAEGRNIRFEQRFASRRADALPELANDLVRMNPRIIVAVNEASLRAAKQATTTIPIIVIAYDHDPVAAGLIDSNTRPGGNVTGIFSRQLELVGKRLELLRESMPGLSRVAVLLDRASEPPAELEAAGKQLGLKLRTVQIANQQESERAIKQAAASSQAAVLLYSPMIFDNRLRIAALAIDARLPLMTQASEFVQAGALMSYAPDRNEVAARAAYYIDRILRGATPAELPVEEAARFKLSINLKSAKALGVTIPQSILLRADEVIR
jgi:putative ABC transport system substrate-binding protein